MTRNRISEQEYKRSVGKNGEDFAVRYLKSHGYKILERNYKTKYGEIDIIALDGPYIVFVEVKKREHMTYGEPEFSITKSKQLHITKSALAYIKMKNLKNKPTRFDVLTISGERTELIKNAFQSSRHFFY